MTIIWRRLRLALWGMVIAVIVVAAACAGRQAPTAPAGTGANNPAPNGTALPPNPADTNPAATTGPYVGKQAPAFVARDVYTGAVVKLADLKGQPVLINFWATWCPPCKQEMPDLKTLTTETKGTLKVVALSGDYRDGAERLAGYATDLGLNFSVANDDGSAVDAYRVVGIPTSFFLDRQGVVRVRHQGIMSLEQMRAYAKTVIDNANP